MMCNYGALPQTFENPDVLDKKTNLKGDGDPIDVLEIGLNRIESGEIKSIKILGILGMIDQDEMDWKVIAINEEDEMAEKVNDIEDVRKYFKGLLESIFDFFENYKTVEGKGKNKFYFDGEFKNKNFAIEVINEASKQYKNYFNKK